MALDFDVPELDVVIPVKNRTTVLQCVSVLLSQLSLAETVRLGTLWLCDGGSDDAACLSQLAEVAKMSGVRVLQCPHAGFNKSWLLNQGLTMSTAQLVMISDVDILWNAEALATLAAAALDDEQNLCSVEKVTESEADAVAIRRERYAYHIEWQGQDVVVAVRAATLAEDNRPGCGLLCGQRAIFERVGGYRDCFVGWGWEDQDLLMRAQLLGHRVVTAGQVVHLTHGEKSRNLLTIGCRPEVSRDRNILRCLQGLEKGQLQGDLPVSYSAEGSAAEKGMSGSITVRYPPKLCS